MNDQKPKPDGINLTCSTVARLELRRTIPSLTILRMQVVGKKRGKVLIDNFEEFFDYNREMYNLVVNVNTS